MVVKFVTLRAYKPDWDAKTMVENENGLFPNHYVPSEQVIGLIDQQRAEMVNAVEDSKRERIALDARIAQLQFALQQAQGGR